MSSNEHCSYSANSATLLLNVIYNEVLCNKRRFVPMFCMVLYSSVETIDSDHDMFQLLRYTGKLHWALVEM